MFFRCGADIVKGRESLFGHDAVFGEDDHPLDDVSQLPDISRIIIGKEKIFYCALQPADSDIIFLLNLFEKETDKFRQVFLSLAKGRDLDDDGAYTVEKIFPEFPVPYFFRKILVGGGDELKVNLPFCVAADALNLL